MKPQNLHAHEDRLLDFAYGELPLAEARAMEAHLQGCARCSEALADIRGVRTTMSRLVLEPAPDAGLESLLAYAQQAARHVSEGRPSTPSRWRRWLMPAVGLAAVSFFGIVSHQVSTSVDLQPSFSKPPAQEAPAPVSKDAYPEAPAPTYPEAQEQERQEAKVAPALAEAIAASDAPVQSGSPPPPRSAPPKKSVRLEKAAPARGARADWGNATSGAGPSTRERAKSKEALAYDAEGSMPPPAPAPAQLQAPMPQAAPMAQAPMAAREERSSLRLGGTSRRGSRAVPSGAVTSSAPSDDEFDELFGAGASSAPSKKDASGASPSEAATLSQRALEAYRAGDRRLEARLLRKALEEASSGRERVGLLLRLCDAEFALGQRDAATEACTRILSEDPGSSTAELARGRLSREASPSKQAAPAEPAAPAERPAP